ncbi:hypothetical protein PHMEG_00019843 [Phytophthora megakarya]|uniref:Reverse transcriptase domain-containing protein n=1 Tax=Phytophthora megakarya TaxID=4795 RepID=A0A225VS46_9STRA|nr:hypothetical protein PHMEG_00019843 [Phytophthora megakarya]
MVPLVKSLSTDEDSAEGMHVTGGPTNSLQIPAGEWIEFRLQKQKPSLGTHDFWVRHTAALIPTITLFRKRQPTLVLLTNITDRVVYCPAHLNVIAWVPRGFMPKQAGYVPIDSRKSASCTNDGWPSVERKPYTWPTSILQKFDEYSSDGDDSLSQDDQWSMESVARSIDSVTDGSPVGDDRVRAAVALGATTPTPTESPDVNQDCNNSPTETQSEEKSPDAAVADLEHSFMCVMHVLSTEDNGDPADDDYAVHEANYISLEDYGSSVTELDYTAPNVKNSSFRGDQQRRFDEVLKKHEATMISSGNALPPPADGVKLYELLKGLLKAGLITFSGSPWASPIVIVLKKNGQDIRLCIDYKMVNAVTAIMEYAMPLVDDWLTELENYLWCCSLDAASGFWAIMMTMRARKVSAFVLAPNAIWIEECSHDLSKVIDNALWGFEQPKDGWERYAERIKLAAEAATGHRSLDDDSDFTLTTTRAKFEADRQASSELDPALRTVNDPYAAMFATNEPDESSLVPVFQHRSFVDDICFGGTTFDDCLDTLDKLLARFEECRISVSFTKSIFCQSKVDFLSHEVSPEGIRADPKKMTAITKVSYPKSKKGMQQFLGSLNYYSRFIQDFAVYGAASALYQSKVDDFFDGSDLAAAKESFSALQ